MREAGHPLPDLWEGWPIDIELESGSLMMSAETERWWATRMLARTWVEAKDRFESLLRQADARMDVEGLCANGFRFGSRGWAFEGYNDVTRTGPEALHSEWTKGWDPRLLPVFRRTGPGRVHDLCTELVQAPTETSPVWIVSGHDATDRQQVAGSLNEVLGVWADAFEAGVYVWDDDECRVTYRPGYERDGDSPPYF